MAKKRRERLSAVDRLIPIVGIGLIVLIAVFLVGRGGGAFLRDSSLFTVHEISLAEDLKLSDFPELEKLRGQNIFSIDLPAIEKKMAGRHPSLAGLRIMRRLPDQIDVTAIRRDKYCLVNLQGRVFWADKDGWLIAPPADGDPSAVAVRGLKDQKPVNGERIRDLKFADAVRLADMYLAEKQLAGYRLKTVDVSDMSRVVLNLVFEQGGFDVYVTLENFSSRLGNLAALLLHGGVEAGEVSYIDLRFHEPVIGRKKSGKS